MTPRMPPFLQAQTDCASGRPYDNPHPVTGGMDNPHDMYAAGWRVAQWRAEFDAALKGERDG